MKNMISYQQLINEAARARENAYAPYSGFRVGAAIVTEDGKIFTGCNIENSSFSATNCAERTALFTAVSAGETRFKALAVVGGKEKLLPMCVPCGVCRQVLSEFCSPEFTIILGTPQNYKEYTLQELFPLPFENNF